MPGSWQAIAKRKQEQRDSLIPQDWRLGSLPSPDVLDVTNIPRTCGILTAEELDITENYDAIALAESIAAKKLNCVDVTRAFCKRAAIAQQLTNCLTEILFEGALRRAAALQHHIDQYGTTLGPLHGVPISLKDTFKIAGTDSTIGLAALCFKPATTTSPLVSILLDAGAVIYCKTNVPQTMMSLDSENNVFGRTLNPLNRLVTAGGSSGGEGALIGIRGSVLGVGTDIGGSIRIPAMCNGLYGIKPSAHRVPYSGQEGGVPQGLSALKIWASAGPISHSLRDCGLLLRVVDASKPWTYDPLVIPGLWDSLSSANPFPSAESRPLTVGIFSTDHLITPLPPIANLLKEVAAAVSKTGHRVVPVTVPASFAGLQSLTNAMFGLDGGNSMFDLIESHGEPLSTWLTGKMKRKKPKTLDQARDIHAQRELMMKEMLELWRTQDGKRDPIDVIIAPIAPHPVPPIDSFGGVSYTSSFVLLDYPAAVIPVRQFQEKDLDGEIDKQRPSLSSWDALNWKLWPDDREQRRVYLQTPLCIQVIGQRLQEKRLFEAMEAIDEALKATLKASKGDTRARL